MKILQPGDTVEILEDDLGPHPTEDRMLKTGDRIVLVGCLKFYVEYHHVPSGYVHLVNKRYVKKVTLNQVEVKFR
jgi:hypothetical protein